MTFQTALRIADVLKGIQQRKYVLPAIQREFVWKPAQIEELLDSLMRGYPIGSFLFWEVQPQNVDHYAFFEFITNYDVRASHNAPANLLNGHGVTAILDGQQRLTAFNIALRGTHTQKTPWLHWNNPSAFVKRQLHLDLLKRDEHAAPDEPMYSFRFLTSEEAARGQASGSHWYCVSKAMIPTTGPEIQRYLNQYGLAADENAFGTLFELVNLVQERRVVSYYLEESEDLDKVLNIFIRVNSGGTVLSYSDLLLSVATAKWAERDAREAVHTLVDDLNDVGQGFKFGKDRVLKASLVLGDFKDIKFKATNFRLDNMLQIEKQWGKISNSLKMSARVLAEFGLSGETLTAENVVIPIAYYINHRGLTEGYLKSAAARDDRQRVASWVIKSLLRAGFWTGAVDKVLLAVRGCIKEHGSTEFPVERIETSVASIGKSLMFEEAEIEDLLRTPYKHRNVTLILSLLYPGFDVSQAFHKDHVFPRSVLSRRKLEAAGVAPTEIEALVAQADQLPNLQLLYGVQNEEKAAMLPKTWADTHLARHRREQFLQLHDLDPLPKDIGQFGEFFERRRDVMRIRLRKLLT